MEITTWSELDVHLGDMRRITAQRDALAAKHDVKIQKAQEAKAADCQPLEDQLAKMEERALEFVQAHGADLKKKRSKKLVHGTVGFRKSAASLRMLLKKDAVIALLRQRGHLDCVEEKVSLCKAAAKKLPPTEMSACGLSLTSTETAFVELAASEIIAYPDATTPTEPT